MADFWSYFVGRLGLFGLTVALFVNSASANRGYLVVLPSTFRPDVEEVLSVTILQPTEPIYVHTKLFSVNGLLLAEAGHEIFGKGTVKLKVPANAQGLCNLKICGNCHPVREGTFSFYNSSVVQVDPKGTSVFMQTDKPIYKPTQTVHINVIMTGPDLRPTNPKLVLSIVDPNQSVVTKWRHLESLCCGIVNTSFPLSDQPVLGTWTVVADVQGHKYSKEFDIEKYVLPKFEVSIQAPTYIRDWTICEKVFIHARYTFGQNVRGLVKLQYSIRGIGYYSDHYSSVHTVNSKIYGTISFDVCIADIVSQKFPDHFRGQLHLDVDVATPDGSSVHASDESCPVNKQLVDLIFSKDSRTNFKPELPFKGSVLVQYPDGSAANNVTVLVEAEVDGTDFSRQTVVTRRGRADFYIPPLPALALSMALNARVRRVEDAVVPDYYFSAHQTVHSSYSPSKCHILIEPRSSTYKVKDEGQFLIYSTCPCNLDMYYDVKARGNLVHSGIHFARHEREHSPASATDSKYPIFLQRQENETYGSKTCTVLIKFVITHEMSPYSRLLVYYVRPGGEGVSDAIKFPVKPDFRNHVSIDLSEQIAMPGESVKLHINTRPNSCVCLAAVDKSVHLLRPGYLLAKDEIFDELDSYERTNELASVSQYHVPGHHGHRTIRSSWQSNAPGSRITDAQYAFEECGLLVMTDTVNLHFTQATRMESRPSYGYQIAQLIASQKEIIRKKRSRVYFPETWIWKCFNTSVSRKDNAMAMEIPDSITTWVFSGISLSPKHGLALAPKTSLRTFQYFFLEMSLPYSVIRGEQVQIPLIVHNYLHACIRVQLELHFSNALEIRDTKDILKKLCIGTEEAKTILYNITFKKLGTQKLAATAEAYADSRCCSGILSEDPPDKHYLTGVDSIKKQVLVEPEGLARYYTHSVYFCPNSRIQLSTPNRYEFQYISRPSHMVTFTFLVKAKNDVRVALSPGPKANDQLIEIVIGGAFNKQSWIMLSETGDVVANTSTVGVVSDEEYRAFWVSWMDKVVTVGYGENPTDNGTIILSFAPMKPLFVEYIGFSTGWGSEGEFQIWKKTKLESSGYGEVMHLSLPDNAIEGSAFARAKLTGDLMGPSMHQLGTLLRLPRGCGEQNMANFAPNVYILDYLQRTNQLQYEVKLKVIKLLTKGYQKQLTYKREDGSYSAFGSRDATGSTWLSAFVLKTYAQARKHVYIDEDELETTKKWLLDRQRYDGSFESVGRLVNKEIQGGVPGRMALTAYVIHAMHQVGIHTKIEREMMDLAQTYLEQGAYLIEDPYTAALTAYTLNLVQSGRAYTVLKKLSQMAIKKNGMMFWKLYSHDVQQFLLFHEESFRGKVSSAEIEIAGYAASAYLCNGDVSSAFPIIKWLTAQRNSFGGFSSTQDTVVALEALSTYAILSYSDMLDMSVSLASTNMDLQERIELNANNSDVVHTIIVPSLPAGLFLSATGEGCAMFQVDVQYHVPDPTDNPAFELWLTLDQQQLLHSAMRQGFRPRPEVRVTLKACTKWLHTGSSNMAVMEITVLTGYQLDVDTVEQLLDNDSLKLKRYEHEGRQLILYFDEIRSGCLTCVSFEMVHKYEIEEQRAVPIRIYDYYEPSYETEKLYSTANIDQFSPDKNQSEPCDPILGCDAPIAIEAEVTCSCQEDCPMSDSPVCASDSSVYPSLCHMELQACVRDLHLEHMPSDYCEPGLLMDGSGDSFEMGETTESVVVDLVNSSMSTEVLRADNLLTVPEPAGTILKENDTETTLQHKAGSSSPGLPTSKSTPRPNTVIDDMTQGDTEQVTQITPTGSEPEINFTTVESMNATLDQVTDSIFEEYFSRNATNGTVRDRQTVDQGDGEANEAVTSKTGEDETTPLMSGYSDNDGPSPTLTVPSPMNPESEGTTPPTSIKYTHGYRRDPGPTPAHSFHKFIKTNRNENELKYKLPPDIHLVIDDRGKRPLPIRQSQSIDRRLAAGFYNKILGVMLDQPIQMRMPSKNNPVEGDETVTFHSGTTPVVEAHTSDNVLDIYLAAEYHGTGIPNKAQDYAGVMSEVVTGPSVLDMDLLDDGDERELDHVTADQLTDKEFMDMIAAYYDFTNMDIPEKSAFSSQVGDTSNTEGKSHEQTKDPALDALRTIIDNDGRTVDAFGSRLTGVDQGVHGNERIHSDLPSTYDTRNLTNDAQNDSKGESSEGETLFTSVDDQIRNGHNDGSMDMAVSGTPVDSDGHVTGTEPTYTGYNAYNEQYTAVKYIESLSITPEADTKAAGEVESRHMDHNVDSEEAALVSGTGSLYVGHNVATETTKTHIGEENTTQGDEYERLKTKT